MSIQKRNFTSNVMQRFMSAVEYDEFVKKYEGSRQAIGFSGKKRMPTDEESVILQGLIRGNLKFGEATKLIGDLNPKIKHPDRLLLILMRNSLE